MNSFAKWILMGGAAGAFLTPAHATDLEIKLAGTAPLSRKIVPFQCDRQAVDLGLPAGPFSVEYVNGGGNSLAILPIGGRSLIFVNVMSASGARYASDRYIWWDAGTRGVTLYSDSLDGKKQTSCLRVNGKNGP